MIIRPASPEDVSGILSLLLQVGHVHHVLRPELFQDNATKYDHAALLELLKDKTRPIFLAVEGSFVKGYCFCVHKDFDGSDVCTRRRELYIDDLCVDEGCRGQGVAKALFRYVRDYAREEGIAFLTLNVWCGNDNAMAFYEAMGMTPRSITMELSMEDTPC